MSLQSKSYRLWVWKEGIICNESSAILYCGPWHVLLVLKNCFLLPQERVQKLQVDAVLEDARVRYVAPQKSLTFAVVECWIIRSRCSSFSSKLIAYFEYNTKLENLWHFGAVCPCVCWRRAAQCTYGDRSVDGHALRYGAGSWIAEAKCREGRVRLTLLLG
jgi:hypothetical protein